MDFQKQKPNVLNIWPVYILTAYLCLLDFFVRANKIL